MDEPGYTALSIFISHPCKNEACRVIGRTTLDMGTEQCGRERGKISSLCKGFIPIRDEKGYINGLYGAKRETVLCGDRLPVQPPIYLAYSPLAKPSSSVPLMIARLSGKMVNSYSSIWARNR